MDTKSQGQYGSCPLDEQWVFGLKLCARENSWVGQSEAEIDLLCAKNPRFEQHFHRTAQVAKSLHHFPTEGGRGQSDTIRHTFTTTVTGGSRRESSKWPGFPRIPISVNQTRTRPS